jgi:hypothetical protein
MKGSVTFWKPPLDASEANATSTTTTRPVKSRGRGSFRGDAKASSGRGGEPVVGVLLACAYARLAALP